MNTNFPDTEFIKALANHMKEKVEDYQDDLSNLLMNCSAAMNWIGDYMTDIHVKWEKKVLDIDDVTLTGTNPEWNKILLDQCQRDPRQVRKLFAENPSILTKFADVTFENLPILVRYEEGKLKVFDGMHRLVAAIRDGREQIEAFVATTQGKPAPYCEAHVVYDVLRPYIRKINNDREGLVVALKYLRKSYANVEELLKNRFNYNYIPDKEIQEIIQESLKD